MAHELTASQINRLGDRLRKGPATAFDLEMLDTFRLSFHGAQQAVITTLRGLGFEAGGRIKTTISIVEKLKRGSTRLSRQQDIGGCRIVLDHVSTQDRAVAGILEAFPNAILIDRRQTPSHGYRAVHVVVEVVGRLVEIQVRTELQHLWARWSETLAGVLDQSIKYGGGPTKVHRLLMTESRIIGEIESRQQRLTSLSHELIGSMPPPPPPELMEEVLPIIESVVGTLAAFSGDLSRLEQEVTDRLIHEILILKAKE